MDHNTAGENWGTDFDGQETFIVMEDGGSDGAGTDAGDNILLDGTNNAQNDAGGRVQGETGATSYVALDTPTNTILKNGTDDYALTAGELQIGYDEFSDVETVDVNLILGGQGGGAGNTASSQDTHVTMLTALVDERRDCVAFVLSLIHI